MECIGGYSGWHRRGTYEDIEGEHIKTQEDIEEDTGGHRRGHRRTPGSCVRTEAAVPPWWRGGEVVGAEGNHGISSNLSEKGLGQYFPQLLIRTIISEKNPENMASHLSHAYTYRLPEEQQSAVEISLRFPRISSFRFKLFFQFPNIQLVDCGRKKL